MDDLFEKWNKGKEAPKDTGASIREIITKAKQKKRASQAFHYGNIGVLGFVLLGLGAFFLTVAPVQDTLSHIALVLMLGGLAARIAVEAVSARKLKDIEVTDTTATVNQNAVQFYNFRRKVHGPVTVSIIIAYCIGVGLLIPEFSKYLSVRSLTIYYIGFLVWGIIFIYFIRKKIKREVSALHELTRIGQAHTAE